MTFPMRKPLYAADRAMIGLEELEWPVSFGYIVQAPWGTTRQMLTVNVPTLTDNLAATRRLGWLLWGIITAPAVVGDVRLTHVSVTFWKSLGVAVPMPVTEIPGNRIGTAARRADTPQMVMLTGHGDDDGKRRWFLPGAPSHWTRGGLLTVDGYEALLPHATGCMLGLATPGLGSGIEWLIAYPGILQETPGNLTGTAFRKVTHLRVVHHLDKAPEVTGIGSV